MKTKVVLSVLFCLVSTILFAQDSVEVKESFYSKYSVWIWAGIGLIGGGTVIAFLNNKLNKVYSALKTIIEAAQDGHVSEAEFQTIVRAIKAIWAKEIQNAEPADLSK